MKWFKHDTDGLISEGLSYLLDKEGFSGYGRWFRLLEIIALKMDSSENCGVEYPVSKWCSLLGLKQKRLFLFLKLAEEKLKIKISVQNENTKENQNVDFLLSKQNENIMKTLLKQNENKLKTKAICFQNIIRIEIPNLLKKRDEYSSKSGQKEDNVLPKNKEIRNKNKDIRKNIKKEKLSDEDFLLQLRKTYSWVDFNFELKKIDLWLANNPQRKKTKKFLINWFGRKEKPLSINESNKTDGRRVIKNSYDCYNCHKNFTDYNEYLTHLCKPEAPDETKI